MKDQYRFIFRDNAIQHYARGRNRSVFPQFASPRVTSLLWVLSGLLLCCGLLAWLIRIPVYASGVGVVIESIPTRPGEVGVGPRLAVFLSDKELPRLRVGQRLSWSVDKRGGRISRTLNSIEKEVSSPMVVQSRFKLSGAAASVITKPVAIAFVNLEPMPDNLPASVYVGSVYRVEVEVGRMRAVSLLPFTSRFSGE